MLMTMNKDWRQGDNIAVHYQRWKEEAGRLRTRGRLELTFKFYLKGVIAFNKHKFNISEIRASSNCFQIVYPKVWIVLHVMKFIVLISATFENFITFILEVQTFLSLVGRNVKLWIWWGDIVTGRSLPSWCWCDRTRGSSLLPQSPCRLSWRILLLSLWLRIEKGIVFSLFSTLCCISLYKKVLYK